MKVRVDFLSRTGNREVATIECDGIDVDRLPNLVLFKGKEPIAVFAAGCWLNASVKQEDEATEKSTSTPSA